jgi:YD repeat-containing protein
MLKSVNYKFDRFCNFIFRRERPAVFSASHLLFAVAVLAVAACERRHCGGVATGALGGVTGGMLGAVPGPVPPGGSVTATRNEDGTVTITARDGDGNVTSTRRIVPSTPGPGVRGEPAAGPVDSGYTYGDTHYNPDGSGTTDILDRNGKFAGCKFFGPPTPVPGWEGVPPDGAIRFKDDGTKQILDRDGQVIAELPPVVPGTKPEDGVRREPVPRTGGGFYWVYYDAQGRVVDIEYVPWPAVPPPP